jgi:hypothetical protein
MTYKNDQELDIGNRERGDWITQKKIKSWTSGSPNRGKGDWITNRRSGTGYWE